MSIITTRLQNQEIKEVVKRKEWDSKLEVIKNIKAEVDVLKNTIQNWC